MLSTEISSEGSLSPLIAITLATYGQTLRTRFDWIFQDHKSTIKLNQSASGHRRSGVLLLVAHVTGYARVTDDEDYFLDAELLLFGLYAQERNWNQAPVYASRLPMLNSCNVFMDLVFVLS